MTMETLPAIAMPTGVVPVEGGNLQLSATKPTEMESVQRALIEWCKQKVTLVGAERVDLEKAVDEARKRKWKLSTLQRHALLAKRRVEFYEKILAALEAGYILVPNFPVTLFAIRTTANSPASLYRISSYKPNFALQQEAQNLPAGEGVYQNPFPHTVERLHEKQDGKGGFKNEWQCWADSWKELDFPITMAKPHLMQMTDEAMKQKVFDELGVLPSPYKKKDPLIVGRIRDPRASKWTRDGVVTFIIAWHLDTRTL